MCTDTDPESCAYCYSIWCIGFGAVMLILNVLVFAAICRGAEPEFFGEPAVSIVVFIFGSLTSIASICAGVLMLLGINKDKPKFFKIGKILSYVLPIAYCFLIFPLVVHIIAVFDLCEYQKDRWD